MGDFKNKISTIAARWSNSPLMLRIAIGLVIGVVLALTLPQAKFISIFGVVFVGALKAIAPILVFVLVVSALSKTSKGVGKRFRTVVVLYLTSTLLAAMVAVFASRLFPVEIQLTGTSEASGNTPDGLGTIFGNMLLNVVANPLQAIANANYLGVLFWAILIGLALKKMAGPSTIKGVTELADSVSMVVRWIIECAPFGIMGLVFSSVSDGGLNIFGTYGKLLLLLIGCMLTTSLVINPIIIAITLKQNPYPLVFRCIKESGLHGFFTRSSAANIPINMQLCERMGLDRDFYSVSIPLGSTINMDGAATTITVMSLAVCNTLGIEVSITEAIILSIISTLAACGASGVAGGSLLLIPLACSLFGISNDISMQAVAVGFIIGVVQDSVETALNSSGDAMFTATADYLERKRKKDIK